MDKGGGPVTIDLVAVDEIIEGTAEVFGFNENFVSVMDVLLMVLGLFRTSRRLITDFVPDGASGFFDPGLLPNNPLGDNPLGDNPFGDNPFGDSPDIAAPPFVNVILELRE
eukprot:CAMPEP_0175041656 /NCGR_PEP_ID=MMETSP0052_2-20121109/2057_1 /TAXON_ID=51329 ORGANISM="Polytomella parva, Strain SAG 63-3" /NCGR_SAMPLE_ID=MMETSP0052_2 /ASSEMBLY_ACC=CAM_ASM_000194 /LENGTH=110 /DNA_ID=CAMNT_0016304237 /DNA_START=199 /DNA_END=528 /DNA_ORIENTATION=+